MSFSQSEIILLWNAQDARVLSSGGCGRFDICLAALQYCCMTAIAVSKRWTITLPPEIRKGLGLEGADHPMMLMELRDGGVFLHPATAMPVRDIPLKQMQQWIASDEADAELFWKSASKKKHSKPLRPKASAKHSK